jgi:biopolymer transport protein ExbB/TolQ
MMSFSIKKNSAGGSRAFMLGMAISGVYYFIVHQPFMRDSILHSYTTHHITEYAIVMLFFWANAEHFFCYRNSSRERAAAGRKWLPVRAGLEEPEHAGALLNGLAKSHAEVNGTMMYHRIQSALRFVYERRSADGYREYLESLAARDADEVFDRYGFSRFVTAILPIVGLIGTVVHFGTALSGLSMEGLSEKLPAMLSGMGTAFNTTFTAMSGLAVTMLIRFLIERRENGVLHKINAFVEDELLYRFKSVDGTLTPFIDAVKESQTTMLTALGTYEQRLAEEWYGRLNATQMRWEQVDQRQEENLVHFLRIVEKQQLAHLQEVHKFNNDLVLAQKLMNQVATTIVADGQLLTLQDRLVENLAILRQSQQLEGAMHELTAAIHLFTARQNASSHRAAA